MLPLPLKLSLPKRFYFLSKLILVSLVGHTLLFLSCVIVIGKKEKLVIPIHLQDAPIVVLPFVKTVGKIGGARPGFNGAGPSTKIQTTFIEKAPRKAKPKPAKKAVQKKVVAPKPIVEKKPIPAKAEQIKQEPLKKEIKEVAHLPAQTINQVLVQEQGVDPALIIGRDDSILFALISELKNDIEQSWERPGGLPNDVLYSVNLAIDSIGNVTVLEEKSSGALALDITARSFLMSYNFPKRVWGREIELTL